MTPSALIEAAFDALPTSAFPPLNVSVAHLISSATPSYLVQFGRRAGFASVRVGASAKAGARACTEYSVVIGVDSPETISLFRALADVGEPPERPVMILLTHAFEQMWSAADFFCDREPYQLLRTIAAAGAMHARALHLTIACAERQARIDAFAAKEQQMVRLTNELALFQQAIARNVAHELNTPMLQVKAAVAGIADQLPPANRLVDFAVQATSRLEGVIQDITMLAEGMDVRLQPIIAQDVVDVALRDRRRRWSQAPEDERILVEMEPVKLVIEADYKGLSIVMQHLIDNALKFSAEKIQVSVSRERQNICFAVEDHGIGISRKHRSRIFDPFFQVDSGHARLKGGTGLGLTLARMILDKHGTQLLIESQKGVGSRFSFTLPILEMRDDLGDV
jgi:signal transduction histidine kinase